jgi:hypothetical protein
MVELADGRWAGLSLSDILLMTVDTLPYLSGM